MTKSELVEQVADRAELTRSDASKAVDAMLATVEDALRRGSEVTVSGFGKFHVSERGAARRGQPAHRRAHPDRRIEGPALHRGQRPEERGEGPLTARFASFGDTLAARVAERESQIVLGLDPDPLRPVAGRRSRAAAGLAPERAAAAAVREHCLALLDGRRRRRAWRSSPSSPASRSWARPGWAAAGGAGGGTRAGRACW